MSDPSLLQAVDDDLQLIYDVVQVLTPLANTNPAIPPLIDRAHQKQAELLKVRSELAQE